MGEIKMLENEKEELIKIKDMVEDMAEDIAIEIGEILRAIDQKVYELQKKE